MSSEYEQFGVAPEAGRKGGVVATAPAVHPGYIATRREAGEVAYLGISRASWPAIWAGFFMSAIVYVLLNTLGVALGFTWLNNDQMARNELSTAAGVWLIATSLITFFVGGCVTGSMAALPGRNTGFMNGILFGCFALVLFAVLAITPTVSALPSLMRFWAQMGVPNQFGQAPAAGAAQVVAWWSLAGMVLALLAAGFGGMSGARRAAVDPLATGDEPLR